MKRPSLARALTVPSLPVNHPREASPVVVGKPASEPEPILPAVSEVPASETARGLDSPLKRKPVDITLVVTPPGLASERSRMRQKPDFPPIEIRQPHESSSSRPAEGRRSPLEVSSSDGNASLPSSEESIQINEGAASTEREDDNTKGEQGPCGHAAFCKEEEKEMQKEGEEQESDTRRQEVGVDGSSLNQIPESQHFVDGNEGTVDEAEETNQRNRSVSEHKIEQDQAEEYQDEVKQEEREDEEECEEQESEQEEEELEVKEEREQVDRERDCEEREGRDREEQKRIERKRWEEHERKERERREQEEQERKECEEQERREREEQERRQQEERERREQEEREKWERERREQEEREKREREEQEKKEQEERENREREQREKREREEREEMEKRRHEEEQEKERREREREKREREERENRERTEKEARAKRKQEERENREREEREKREREERAKKEREEREKRLQPEHPEGQPDAKNLFQATLSRLEALETEKKENERLDQERRIARQRPKSRGEEVPVLPPHPARPPPSPPSREGTFEGEHQGKTEILRLPQIKQMSESVPAPSAHEEGGKPTVASPRTPPAPPPRVYPAPPRRGSSMERPKKTLPERPQSGWTQNVNWAQSSTSVELAHRQRKKHQEGQDDSQTEPPAIPSRPLSWAGGHKPRSPRSAATFTSRDVKRFSDIQNQMEHALDEERKRQPPPLVRTYSAELQATQL